MSLYQTSSLLEYQVEIGQVEREMILRFLYQIGSVFATCEVYVKVHDYLRY